MERIYERVMEQKKGIAFGTPVLVMDADEDIFVTRDMKDEYTYHCKWNVWKQCIPLEGNTIFFRG